MSKNHLNRRRFLVRSAAVVGASSLSIHSSLMSAAEGDPPLVVGNEPQLLIDDWLVDRNYGLRRVLHQPQKQGLIKEAEGSDWQRGDVYAATGAAVMQDKASRFHMTYRYTWWDPGVRSGDSRIGNDKAHWHRVATAYATSEDGIHWQKPRLGLLEGPTGFKKQADFPFEVATGMSKENNLGCPIDFITDLHANGNVTDPAKRFLLRVGEKSDTGPFAKARSPQMYYAADWPDFATDSNWKRKLTPIPRATLSPRGFNTLAGYDHPAREWFTVTQDTISNWLKRGGRDIARYSSPDMISWSGHGAQLALPVAKDESKQTKDWVEYMDLSAYRVGGPQSGVWLGQLVVFHGDRSNHQYEAPQLPPGVWRKGLTELRLVISRDAGRSWQRVCGKEVWLPYHEDEHGYDRLVFSTLPTPVKDGLRFYYSVWDGDHLCFNNDGSTFYTDRVRSGRTAWATLRRDGYVSLDADDAGGELLTKPLRFEGGQLAVNVAAARGALRVELQDAAGRPLDGHKLNDCTPVTADGLDVAVAWRGGGNLANVAGQPIRVRFALQSGSLYGFRFA